MCDFTDLLIKPITSNHLIHHTYPQRVISTKSLLYLLSNYICSTIITRGSSLFWSNEKGMMWAQYSEQSQFLFLLYIIYIWVLLSLISCPEFFRQWGLIIRGLPVCCSKMHRNCASFQVEKNDLLIYLNTLVTLRLCWQFKGITPIR